MKATTKVYGSDGKLKTLSDHLSLSDSNPKSDLIPRLLGLIGSKVNVELNKINAQNILSEFSKPKN